MAVSKATQIDGQIEQLIQAEVREALQTLSTAKARLRSAGLANSMAKQRPGRSLGFLLGQILLDR